MAESERLSSGISGRRVAAVVVLSAVGVLVAAGVAILWLGGAGHGAARVTAEAHGRASLQPGARQRLASLPLGARGAVSAALGRSDSRYRVLGLRGSNPAQGLETTFSRAGARVASGPANVRLALAAYGHAGAVRQVAPVAPRVMANRVVYVHDGVEEWYVNGPAGLEQGFDVTARMTRGRGPLTLSLRRSGNARARLDRGGVVMRDEGHALLYGGLQASDARGRRLRSWFALRRGRLLIRVADRGAAYPLRIDPFLQQAELTESDGGAGDHGGAVAVSGDTIVVGAPGHQVGANPGQGAVYVFVRPSSGWASATQTAKLTASDGGLNDGLGATVAISGDTIVAGAGGHKVGSNASQGAAYVFVKPAGGWTDAHEAAELTASDGAATDGLGSSVAISGDTVVAGPTQHDVGGNTRQGAAYVFVKPASGWVTAFGTGGGLHQTAELTASDGVAGDFLGRTVSVSGDTVIVGAPVRTVGTNASQGMLYLYERPPTGWADATQVAELTASDGAANDQLGEGAVAISGDTVVAGAPFHLVGLSRQGAAYVFTQPLFGWISTTQTAELAASDGATNDRFGLAVAVSGDKIVVGAGLHQVAANAAQGAAYMFVRSGAIWVNATQSAELTASDGAIGDLFGLLVAISGNLAVVGGPFHQVGANAGQGAAYLFGEPPTITIGTPTDGATYSQGQAVLASYSCSAPAGATITACAGRIASGARLDTSGLGAHSFAVSASDSDGLRATQTVNYTVAAPAPSPTKTTPKPAITGLKQSASVWREGSKLARISRKKKPPVGTNFSFALNERAAVALSFSQRTPGRKVRGKCLNQNAKNKHKPRCIRTRVAGTLRFTARQGPIRVHFEGRVSPTRRLKPGRYTLTITAAAAGKRTTSRPLSFRIVK